MDRSPRQLRLVAIRRKHMPAAHSHINNSKLMHNHKVTRLPKVMLNIRKQQLRIKDLHRWFNPALKC